MDLHDRIAGSATERYVYVAPDTDAEFRNCVLSGNSKFHSPQFLIRSNWCGRAFPTA